MRKLVLVMHVSVDGFVAGKNGEMDWIYVDEEMFEIASQQTSQANTALYGRVTFEMMDGYSPGAAEKPGATKHDIQHSGWYNRVEKMVLSTTLPQPSSSKTTIIGKDAPGEIRARKQKPGGNILVFGSPTVVHLLTKEDLIDELWLFINPVVLGEGIPLFIRSEDRSKLRLLHSKVFSGGVVCLHYERQRND